MTGPATANLRLASAAGRGVLLAAVLRDRFGRRRIFLLGVVWFTVASLLCGLAQSVEWLVVARAVQGIGAALLTPGSLALMQASFHSDDRGRAIGAWSGLSGVSTAVGPFVGGWLIDAFSWRWIFFLNVPLAAAMLWCAGLLLGGAAIAAVFVPRRAPLSAAASQSTGD